MFNISTAFIDLLAWIGWATELKTVPDKIVKDRIARTGDGSHKHSKELELTNNNNNNKNEDDDGRDIDHFWGWGK